MIASTPLVAAAFVVLAGAGTVVRAEVGHRANRDGRPLGTFAVNITGSLALGLIAGLGDAWTTVLGAGLVGALTTFSTFVGEVASLVESGERARAATYVVATMGACVAAAWLGLTLS